MVDSQPARRESRRFSLPVPGIKRRQTHYQAKSQRPRWVLHVQATFWRVLMGLGMWFHRMAPPRPPHPTFSRTIPSTVSSLPGVLTLHFYVPKGYETQRQLYIKQGDFGDNDSVLSSSGSTRSVHDAIHSVGRSLRRRSPTGQRWGGYPVVINFHGGGFTLGTAIDDARWCGTVVDECGAVVVSVDYRLAPECPFPTAVDDGVDAVLWIHKHASELGIDPEKIALSGFSSGGNMAFSVPLRLHDHLTGFKRVETHDEMMSPRPETVWEESPEALSSQANLLPPQPTSSAGMSTSSTADATSIHQQTLPRPTKTAVTSSASERFDSEEDVPRIPICCIVPWYPSLDYTRTREHRRETCKRADQELPAFFTDLFDDSYLHPPKSVPLNSPYLSPGVAPTELLRAALPHEIILHTCEWDMLLEEGEAFHERLISQEVGKHVVYQMVPGVPHGWDKAPNPIKPTPGVREYYLAACQEMRRCFGPQVGLVERRTEYGMSAAPRESVQIVR